MSLQSVLAEIDPHWYTATGEAPLPPALIRQARGSALGERMLARWLLAAGHAEALLTPTPAHGVGAAAVRWPRARLQALVRDLGVLAYAPSIRAEVGRDAVRQLKHALGNSYLLALDKTVWDGRIDAQSAARMRASLRNAIAAGEQAQDTLFALLERQGRGELRGWEAAEARGLAEWAVLLQAHADERPSAPVLPAGQVRMLHEHHLGRARSA